MIDLDFTQLPFSLLDEEHRHRLENAMEKNKKTRKNKKEPKR